MATSILKASTNCTVYFVFRYFKFLIQTEKKQRNEKSYVYSNRALDFTVVATCYIQYVFSTIEISYSARYSVDFYVFELDSHKITKWKENRQRKMSRLVRGETIDYYIISRYKMRFDAYGRQECCLQWWTKRYGPINTHFTAAIRGMCYISNERRKETREDERNRKKKKKHDKSRFESCFILIEKMLVNLIRIRIQLIWFWICMCHFTGRSVLNSMIV